MKDSGHSFGAYFKRATSPLVVLTLLLERPMYGYEIATEMRQRSNGKFTISVLYPVLYRLESQGFVEALKTKVIEGRARGYYRITKEGEHHLRKSLNEFKEFAALFSNLTEAVSTEEA